MIVDKKDCLLEVAKEQVIRHCILGSQNVPGGHEPWGFGLATAEIRPAAKLGSQSNVCNPNTLRVGVIWHGPMSSLY